MSNLSDIQVEAAKRKAAKPVETLTPLHDRVLVRKTASREKSAGGIIIPETSQDGETVTGDVVAIGPGRWEYGVFVPTTVRVGQRVSYFKHAGTSITTPDGEKLVTLMESELVAVVETRVGVK